VKNLTYKNIISIGRMQPAISAVKGHTLYGVSNLDEVGNPKDDSAIVILEKGGIARQMKSRAEKSRQLMGTKRTIVSTANVYVGRGKLDGASVLILPILGEKGFAEKLLLLHIEYNDLLPLAEKTEALGYRYNDIRNMVSEYNIAWHDEYLEKIPLADLFGETIENLAGRIVQNLPKERA
jgi:glucosamine--fructose-6-phosphate aminotransferase (isomerizing)